MIRIVIKSYGGYLTESRTVVEIPAHKARELVRDLTKQLAEKTRVS